MKTKEEVKSTQKIFQPKMFYLSKKMLPGYQTNVLLWTLKFTPRPKHNIIQFKPDIHKYTRKPGLTKLPEKHLKITFHKKVFKTIDVQDKIYTFINFLIETKSNLIPPRNRHRGLDHPIGILNNLELEWMGAC